MREKVQNTIDAMKKQTIGVEIEMNNIKRSAAAKLAAEFFGTDRYDYTGDVHGYSTWSAWDGQNREWKFQKDVSINGPDDKKCELVTPILTYDDIETLQELIRRLRHAGAKSNSIEGCGVHVHIGAQGHTPQTLRNLANIMASHEDLLIKSMRIAPTRTTQYCKTVDKRFLDDLNKKKPTTMAKLADIWYGSQGCDYNRDRHYNSSRYHQLNYHAVFTKGTIEFRLFQFDNPYGGYKGGLHAGKLKSFIQLALALSQAAKEAKSASPRKQITDNPKYAMRCWLLRLGFIGDEFATARDLLTRNLDGDAAFRHGRPQNTTDAA